MGLWIGGLCVFVFSFCFLNEEICQPPFSKTKEVPALSLGSKECLFIKKAQIYGKVDNGVNVQMYYGFIKMVKT